MTAMPKKPKSKSTPKDVTKLVKRASTKSGAGTTRRKKVTSQPLHKRVRRRVKLAVIPHKANQYRPHLIRRYGIAAVLVLVLIVQLTYNVFTSGSVLGERSELSVTGLLAATNQERVGNGEAPLRINDTLSKAAKLKVENMFSEQYWAHTAPDGKTPWYWFGQVDYNYTSAGENLAKNFLSDSSTVAAWMASPSHRANILDADYKDVGFATAHGMLDGQQTTLVVALYGDPVSTSEVAGVTSTNAADMSDKLSLGSRFELGVGQLSPVAIGGILALLILANLALLAQAYRDKLPRALRASWWYKHHGIYKAFGLVSVVVVIVLTYGGIGQI